MPVGDVCKYTLLNIYEPLYPVVELITISKSTRMPLAQGLLPPMRSLFRNNCWKCVWEGKTPTLILKSRNTVVQLGGCLQSIVSVSAAHGGNACLGHPAPLTKAGSIQTFNLFHCLVRQALLILLQFNED